MSTENANAPREKTPSLIINNQTVQFDIDDPDRLQSLQRKYMTPFPSNIITNLQCCCTRHEQPNDPTPMYYSIDLLIDYKTKTGYTVGIRPYVYLYEDISCFQTRNIDDCIAWVFQHVLTKIVGLGEYVK